MVLNPPVLPRRYGRCIQKNAAQPTPFSSGGMLLHTLSPTSSNRTCTMRPTVRVTFHTSHAPVARFKTEKHPSQQKLTATPLNSGEAPSSLELYRSRHAVMRKKDTPKIFSLHAGKRPQQSHRSTIGVYALIWTVKGLRGTDMRPA